MMAKMFIQPGSVERILDRIRRGVDHGAVEQRPAFDPRERADAEKRTADGRSVEAYRSALEAHEFRWFPAARMLARALTTGMGAGPAVEGQWRSKICGGMAFSPSDLLSLFKTPEDLARWLKRETLKHRLLARRDVSKVERRVALGGC